MWQINKSFISRINKHFDSRGGKGNFTMLFDNFPHHIQTEILTLLGVSTEEEKPLIASYRKGYYCLLLTTHKLWWNNPNNNTLFVNLENIIETRTQIKYMNPKCDIFRLGIITKDDKQLEFQMEAGRPFSGVWNVILMIIGLRKE
jgi:hypothetical protein